MMKNKVLRLQFKNLRKKNPNIKKIKNFFNKTGVIVIENILNKKNCDFFINLLEKNYLKYKHLYFSNKQKKIAAYSQSYNAKTVIDLHCSNICAYLDGKIDLIDLSNILSLDINILNQIIKVLKQKKIIKMI